MSWLQVRWNGDEDLPEAPDSTNADAIMNPIPDEPPVTSTVLPLTLKSAVEVRLGVDMAGVRDGGCDRYGERGMHGFGEGCELRVSSARSLPDLKRRPLRTCDTSDSRSHLDYHHPPDQQVLTLGLLDNWLGPEQNLVDRGQEG